MCWLRRWFGSCWPELAARQSWILSGAKLSGDAGPLRNYCGTAWPWFRPLLWRATFAGANCGRSPGRRRPKAPLLLWRRIRYANPVPAVLGKKRGLRNSPRVARLRQVLALIRFWPVRDGARKVAEKAEPVRSNSSSPRRRPGSSAFPQTRARKPSHWIPAFAGMTRV